MRCKINSPMSDSALSGAAFQPPLRQPLRLAALSLGLVAWLAPFPVAAQGFTQQLPVQAPPGALIPAGQGQGQGQVTLNAGFTIGNQPIRSGLVWRIVVDKAEGGGTDRETQCDDRLHRDDPNLRRHGALSAAQCRRRPLLHDERWRA